MKIAVLGATGRTGREVVAAIEAAPDLELAGALSSATHLTSARFEGVDAVIDFSLPTALRAALPLLGSTPLVTGTTGLDEADHGAIRAQATRAPVLQAANFSVGLTLLLDLAARAAGALPDYDLEIVETHHRHKRDSPSGTALALGRVAAAARNQDLDAVARHGRHGDVGPRPAGEIGFHAVRGGGVVGEHTLSLSGDHERIVLGHVVQSRAAFADGALLGARWLVGRRPGLYSLGQVLLGN